MILYQYTQMFMQNFLKSVFLGFFKFVQPMPQNIKYFLLALAVRVGLSELQWKIKRSRGVNSLSYWSIIGTVLCFTKFRKRRIYHYNPCHTILLNISNKLPLCDILDFRILFCTSGSKRILFSTIQFCVITSHVARMQWWNSHCRCMN